MGSDSSYLCSRTTTSRASTKSLLLEELQKAKEKLDATPHPYCEINCPWLALCRNISPSGCILSDLIDPSLWQ